MTAVWYRFRTELRVRWKSVLALALLAGIAGGATLAAVAGARGERIPRSHGCWSPPTPPTCW